MPGEVEFVVLAFPGGSIVVIAIEAGGLVTDNAIRVGEWVPGGNFTYTNVNLGQIAAAGLDNVRIWYNGPGFGTPLVEGTMTVVPEPASIALIGLSLCGVLALRRRLVA